MSMYASRADLDALIQQLQSNPGVNGRAFFRGILVVVDRSYLGVAGPAADTWDSFYSYQGRGGVLNPDRQIEFRLIIGATNNSGRDLWYLVRLRLNAEVFFEAQAWLQDGDSFSRTLEWRIIATGGNDGQLLDVRYAGGTAVISNLTEPLAEAWAVTFEATWRDDVGGGASPDTVLTLPADAYFFRYHALAVLT